MSKGLSPSVSDKHYIPGLDGLRSLAVLAVMAYHFNFQWAGGGLLGVCLFFVLSGYLITDLLVNEWEQTGKIDLKNFWIRRAKRLLPALFIMLAGVALWLLLFDPSRLAAYWQDEIASLLYVSNWWFIFHEVSYFEQFGPPSPLGHLWSLAVEEQFYIFWPLLIGLGLKFIRCRSPLVLFTLGGVLASALAMALIYEPGTDPNRVYYGTDTRAFALLIGAALALVWPSRKLNKQLPGKSRWLLDICGTAGLIIVLLLIWRTNQYQTSLYRGGLLLFSLASAIMVAVLAHPASRLGKLFSIEPLRWIGVRSYGIYLWHFPVILLTAPAVNTRGPDLLQIACQTAVCLIIAALSYRLVEEPIRRGSNQSRAGSLSYKFRKPEFAMSGKVTSNVAFLIFGISCLALVGIILNTNLKTDPASTAADPLPIFASSSSSAGSSLGSFPPGLEPNDPLVSLPEKEENGKQSSPATGSEGADNAASGLNQAPGYGEEPAGYSPHSPTDNSSDQPSGNPSDQPSEDSSTNPASDPPAVSPDAGKDVIVIGDSVMVGTAPSLQELMPGVLVDAEVGRQMYQAPSVVEQLKAKGNLRACVVIELGTNGPFTEDQLRKLLDLLGPEKRIILINTRVPRAWESQVNQTLAKVSAEYPNTKLVDWYTMSSGHNDYFYKDGVHLNPAGLKAYAAMIAQAVNEE